MSRRGCAYQRQGRSGWYARVPIDGEYRYRGGFSTKAMAEAWIAGELRKSERAEVLGLPNVRDDVTLDAFLPRWKSMMKPPRVRQSTYDGYCSKADGVLSPWFGEMPLAAILPTDIENFLSERAAEGRSPATLNRDLAVLSSILRCAVKAKCASRNVAREVSRMRESLPPMRYLSAEEEDRLLAALPGWLRTPALVALDAGLRAGEIGALRPADLDFGRDPGLIAVRESKNHQPRNLGMTRRLNEALTRHIDAWPPADDQLFSDPGGRPFCQAVYRNEFEKAVARAKLDGFRFHDLRHACGVRLAEAGATPGEISAFLGHKTLAMTMRYIRHAPRDACLTVARLLDDRRKPKKTSSRRRA